MNAAAQSDQGRLAKGIFVNILGALGRLNRAFYLMVFSRFLDMEAFGLYILAFSIVEIISKISVFGLDFGMMVQAGRLRAQNKGDQIRLLMKRVLLLGLFMSTVIAIGLLFLSKIVAEFILNKPQLEGLLGLFALTIPGLCLTNILAMTLRSTLNMKYENIIRSVIEPLVILVVGSITLYMGVGLEGTAWAHLVGGLVALAAAIYLFYRTHPKEMKGENNDPLPWSGLFSTGLPMAGMELLNMFKLRLDLLIIGRFLPLASVGIYGVITELAGILRKMKAVFDPILMPLSQVIHEGRDKVRLQEHLALALRWILIPSLAIFGANLLAPEAFLRLFGIGYESGANAFRIFVIGQIFWVTLGLLEGVLAMTGHAFIAFIQSISLVGLNLVLLLVLIPIWGLEGASLATTITIIVISAWRLILSKKLLGVWPFASSQRKPIYAFIFSMALGWLLSIQFESKELIHYLFVAGFFILVYFATIFKLGFEKTDEELLKKVKGRLKPSQN